MMFQGAKSIFDTAVRALITAVVWGAVGLGINALSSSPAPWIYEPKTFVEIDGLRVDLCDEKRAHELMESADTVFVDARNQSDYNQSRVKDSIFLPPDGVTDRYPSVEPMLPKESLIVLYCYGPECDMAERTAKFLVEMGYKKLAVMSAGFAAWERAGYPVESDDGAK
ncbi:MAG: rhodanese-like domain-containing protein [Pseudomonadota bacterium]